MDIVDKKKYIITSITLGAIAASSALLIALANLATSNRIAENEKKKILDGIQEIFGESKISNEQSISEFELTGTYTYIEKVYTVTDMSDVEIGLAFRTTGSNAYGKISLLVGYDKATTNFKKMYVVVDEQTYNTELEDNYISPVNNGEYDTDVHCGATFGAKLVKAMLDESEAAKGEIWK